MSRGCSQEEAAYSLWAKDEAGLSGDSYLRNRMTGEEESRKHLSPLRRLRCCHCISQYSNRGKVSTLSPSWCVCVGGGGREGEGERRHTASHQQSSKQTLLPLKAQNFPYLAT